MKKYVKLVLSIILFVGFMAGVYVLYQNLAKDHKPKQNLVVENQADAVHLPEKIFSRELCYLLHL